MKRYGNLIELIVEPENMSRSFDDVVGGLRPVSRQAIFCAHRAEILERLTEEIKSGEFRVGGLSCFEVTTGGKRRVIQTASVVGRIGCNAVMNVVDAVCYRSLIATSAASVKGRGLHYLHGILSRDLRLHADETTYYYKCDVRKFYDSIDHDVMMNCLGRYIKDRTLLSILEGFVRAVPDRGLAIGLRSSQCFGNMLLDAVDHYMKEREGVRFYYRYCDDIVMLADEKKKLWRWRDALVGQLSGLGLEVKGDEAVRPLSEGLDFLGYVHYGSHSLLRKRVKQRFARLMSRVKSRRRRRELMGSFKGMAAHGDCNHLYYTITGYQMKKFSEMGVTYTPADGKKRFPGKMMRLGAIVNKTIEVHDYESGIKTSQGEDRYVVSFFDPATKEWGKFFTASEEMKNLLDQISDIEDGFPFETVIESEVFDGNKVKYKFT